MKQTVISLLMVFLSFHASAQDLLVSTDSSEFYMSLDEVSVQAEKVESKIKDLPLSVTALPARLVERNGIETVNALTGMVPNFFMPDYGSKLTSPVFIRGIGSKRESPSVGLYVDHVPYFEKSAFDFEFYDIESIEILRGPQGTLYGRNTMGGIINIYTRKPGDKRETRFGIDYGNYGYKKLTLYHNQPVTENFAFSLSGAYKDHKGYHHNEYKDQNIDKVESKSVKLKLHYDILNDLEANLMVSYEKSVQGGYPYAILNDSTGDTDPIAYDHYSSYNRDILSSGFRLALNKPDYEVNYTASLQYLDDHQDIDQDFTSFSYVDVIQNNEQFMTSHEMNAFSKNRDGYNWFFGAFSFLQQTDREVFVSYGEDIYERLPLPPGYKKLKYYDQPSEGHALYHQSSYSLNQLGLKFTAGIRLDYERSELDYVFDKEIANNTVNDTAFTGNLNFFEFLPKVSVQKDVFSNSKTYFSIAKGYKAGGFNSTIERDQDKSYKPEQSWNYELGLKSYWLNKRLAFNTALFYIDWRNQQIYQTVPSGQGSMIKNAGKSQSYGIETEVSARIKNIEVFTNWGLNRAEFIEYEKNDEEIYSDNRIPFAPEYTGILGATYSMPFYGSFFRSLNFYANYQMIGDFFWDEENSAKQDAYGLLNGRITLKTKYFDLGVWGKNMTNTDYNSYYFDMRIPGVLDNKYVQKGKPVIFGLSLAVNF
jgi:outer membrane receptor protein involved in Fe transport